MTKEEIIKRLSGRIMRLDYNWLVENDEELLHLFTKSKYWGRGFAYTPDVEEIIVEIYFGDEGMGMVATFESHPDGVNQSIANQPYWFEDRYSHCSEEYLKMFLDTLEGGR